jgi:hypothetical protein
MDRYCSALDSFTWFWAAVRRRGGSRLLQRRFYQEVSLVCVDTAHNPGFVWDRKHGPLDSILSRALYLECFVSVHIRFGWSYLSFMAAKQALVVGIIGLMVVLTCRSVRLSYWDRGQSATVYPRPYLMLAAVLVFTIAYIMIIILFLHEGIDHAL